MPGQMLLSHETAHSSSLDTTATRSQPGDRPATMSVETGGNRSSCQDGRDSSPSADCRCLVIYTHKVSAIVSSTQSVTFLTVPASRFKSNMVVIFHGNLLVIHDIMFCNVINFFHFPFEIFHIYRNKIPILPKRILSHTFQTTP